MYENVIFPIAFVMDLLMSMHVRFPGRLAEHGSGIDAEANTQSLPHMRRTTGGSGEFQRDARRASAFWVFSWNESGLTGLRYGLALRVAHVGRSIIKLVGCTCIPPESFVNFQRELLRGRRSIRAEEFSWQTDSGAPDALTLDICDNT